MEAELRIHEEHDRCALLHEDLVILNNHIAEITIECKLLAFIMSPKPNENKRRGWASCEATLATIPFRSGSYFVVAVVLQHEPEVPFQRYWNLDELEFLLDQPISYAQEQLLYKYPTKESASKEAHYNLGVVAPCPKQNFPATAERSSVGK